MFFVPIPKKSDIQHFCNNRTLALMSHCSKIILKIIGGRININIDEEADEVQEQALDPEMGHETKF